MRISGTEPSSALAKQSSLKICKVMQTKKYRNKLKPKGMV